MTRKPTTLLVGRAAPRAVCLLICAALCTACADPQAKPSAEESEVAMQATTQADMQRVIVSLNTSAGSIPEMVAALEKKYPSAQTVRTLPAFAQVVFELPAADVPALKREPEVQKLDFDAVNHTTP